MEVRVERMATCALWQVVCGGEVIAHNMTAEHASKFAQMYLNQQVQAYFA